MNCALYWSENDQMHTMCGSGACRKWYSQRSDAHLNKCQDFVPLEWQALASASQYCLRLRADDAAGYRVELVDPKAAKTLISLGGAGMREATDVSLRHLAGLSSFLSAVSGKLSRAVRKSKMPVNHFMSTGDVLSNPSSDARKRFSIIVSCFPKSLRVSYRIIRLKEPAVKAMMKFVFAENGRCSIAFSSSEDPNASLSPSEFAERYAYGAAAVTFAAEEMASFQKFIKGIRDAGAKTAKRL